jgi:capsular exopolysaccharide synthesis family protein
MAMVTPLPNSAVATTLSPGLPYGQAPYGHFAAAQPPANNDVSVKQLLMVVWRRRWLLALVVLILMALAAAFCVLVTPRYTAEMTLALNIEPSEQDATQNMEGGIVSKDMSEVGTAINVLLSPGAMRAVVKALHLQDDPEFDPLVRPRHAGILDNLGLAKYWPKTSDIAKNLPEKLQHLLWGNFDARQPTEEEKIGTAQDVVAKHISVTNDGKSYTIMVSVTAYEPEKAARMANTLAQWYIDHRQEWRAQQLDQVAGMLTGRGDALRQQVIKAESAVADYQARHGIVGLTQDNTLAIDALTKLNTELISARSARSEAEANLTQMKQFAATRSREAAAQIVGNAPNLVSVIDQRNQLRAQIAGLSKTYTNAHPAMVDLKSRLSAVDAELDKEINSVLGGTEARLRIARANEADLERHVKELTDTNQKNTLASPELRELQSKRDAAQAIYQNYLQGVGKVSVAAGAQAFDVQIWSPAVPPIWPSFPQTFLIMGLSFVVAVLIGTGVVIMIDSLRRGVYKPEDVEVDNGIRVLGMLPMVKKRIEHDPSLSNMTLDDPLCEHAEALRSVNVALSGGGRLGYAKVILVTSALPGEGKTSLAISLARLAAAGGRSVLLLECDLRRPSFRRSLPCTGPGLTDFLAGKALLSDILRVDPKSGMNFVSSGTRALYPAELLASTRMDAFIDEARGSFDLIVVDTPPVGVVSDALVMASRTDATIMALRHGKTDRRTFSLALGRMVEAGANVAGVVLSHVDLKDLSKYGSGYRALSKTREYYSRAAAE